MAPVSKNHFHALDRLSYESSSPGTINYRAKGKTLAARLMHASRSLSERARQYHSFLDALSDLRLAGGRFKKPSKVKRWLAFLTKAGPELGIAACQAAIPSGSVAALATAVARPRARLSAHGFSLAEGQISETRRVLGDVVASDAQ